MFELAEEHRMLQELVEKFVERELMPLEKSVLAREASGGKIGLPEDQENALRAKCRELGLWGLDVSEEYGGANLPTIALMAIQEEIGRTSTPFTVLPAAPALMSRGKAVDDREGGQENGSVAGLYRRLPMLFYPTDPTRNGAASEVWVSIA